MPEAIGQCHEEEIATAQTATPSLPSAAATGTFTGNNSLTYWFQT